MLTTTTTFIARALAAVLNENGMAQIADQLSEAARANSVKAEENRAIGATGTAKISDQRSEVLVDLVSELEWILAKRS